MRYKIGKITERLGLSADTLRYYEKINLLPKVNRNATGVREYDDKDISRIKFIQRAQKMNFSLTEISNLLKMRENPRKVRSEVRLMTAEKLKSIDEALESLMMLRNELQLLMNLCQGDEEGCPIIEGLDGTEN